MKNQQLVSDIIAYENGELPAEDTIELFAKLIKTGTAWNLQGHYGRTARDLISAGYISAQGKILKYID